MVARIELDGQRIGLLREMRLDARLALEVEAQGKGTRVTADAIYVLTKTISRVFKGQSCEVRPEAFPDRRYQGYVSRLMPTADRSKGAVPVRVKVIVPSGEADGRYLKPDMGVIVSFKKAAR